MGGFGGAAGLPAPLSPALTIGGTRPAASCPPGASRCPPAGRGAGRAPPCSPGSAPAAPRTRRPLSPGWRSWGAHGGTRGAGRAGVWLAPTAAHPQVPRPLSAVSPGCCVSPPGCHVPWVLCVSPPACPWVLYPVLQPLMGAVSLGCSVSPLSAMCVPWVLCAPPGRHVPWVLCPSPPPPSLSLGAVCVPQVTRPPRSLSLGAISLPAATLCPRGTMYVPWVLCAPHSPPRCHVT